MKLTVLKFPLDFFAMQLVLPVLKLLLTGEVQKVTVHKLLFFSIT